MKTKNSSVFIIDDDPNMCDSLRSLFESLLYNVEIYLNAEAFLENYAPNKQGCIILDIRLPTMSGLELLAHFSEHKIHIPVVVMTGYGDIPTAIRAMKLGAIDFIEKPFNQQNLIEIIQKNMSQPKDTDAIEQIKQKIQTLSERENQMLNFICEGKLNKQIAYDMEISISTVEAHRANVMRKMQAKNLAQLIKMYLSHQTTIG